MKRFGELLESYIRKAGLTYEAFGKEVEISEPYVSQLVSGTRYPGKPLLALICRDTGLDRQLADKTIAFERATDPVVKTALRQEIVRRWYPEEQGEAGEEQDDPLLDDIVEIARKIKNRRLRRLLLDQARAILDQDEEMRGPAGKDPLD